MYVQLSLDSTVRRVVDPSSSDSSNGQRRIFDQLRGSNRTRKPPGSSPLPVTCMGNGIRMCHAGFHRSCSLPRRWQRREPRETVKFPYPLTFGVPLAPFVASHRNPKKKRSTSEHNAISRPVQWPRPSPDLRGLRVCNRRLNRRSRCLALEELQAIHQVSAWPQVMGKKGSGGGGGGGECSPTYAGSHPRRVKRRDLFEPGTGFVPKNELHFTPRRHAEFVPGARSCYGTEDTPTGLLPACNRYSHSSPPTSLSPPSSDAAPTFFPKPMNR